MDTPVKADIVPNHHIHSMHCLLIILVLTLKQNIPKTTQKGLCQCFNIDVNQPRFFSGSEDTLFGFSVLQHEVGGEKMMLVGAPWDGPPNNRKGDIYKCVVGEELNSNCSKMNLADSAFQNVSRNLKNSHLGMTLTPNKPNGFLGLNLSCQPTDLQTTCARLLAESLLEPGRFFWVSLECCLSEVHRGCAAGR
ncbi:integrin alpha-10 isoform X1 [Tachysurus ichikawai]